MKRARSTILERVLPAAVVTLGALATTSPVVAEEAVCRLHATMPIERQLRKLSLVLRGQAPAYEEYLDVDGVETISDAKIKEYVATDEFRMQMRRFHEQQLLINPEEIRLFSNNMTLQSNSIGASTVYTISSAARRKNYRGGNGTYRCQDKAQSTLGYTNGRPKCEAKGSDSVGPYCQEGWVQVAPYWNPATTIKVCAFDAQTATTYVNNGETYPCNNNIAAATGEAACGCGKDLMYCAGPGVNATSITMQMREQALMLIDEHTDGQRPYSEMLTRKDAPTNGRIEFYKKHLAPAHFTAYNRFHTGDAPLAADPKWDDLSWHMETRESPHSGLLTLPAFSLRHMTNRARANRFRIAFMGQYFVPPSSPNLEGCSDTDKDLTKRCYCRDCHQILEPMAANFAIVLEAGSGLLTDFAKNVESQTECNSQLLPPSVSNCNRLYARKKDPNDPNILLDEWRLRPLEFAEPGSEIEENFDAGPEPLARRIIEDGTLARATVEHMFAFLVRREMNLDPTDAENEIAIRDELAANFAADDNLPRLAEAIVKLEAFRRMP